MKKVKVLVLSMLAAVSMLMVGCGLFGIDASNYMDLEIQSTYLDNHSDELVSMYGDGTSMEDLQYIYEQGVLVEVEYILSSYSGVDTTVLSQETLDRGYAILDEIYSHTKYEVGEATQVGSNYEIPITIYPIDTVVNSLTTSFYDELIAEIESITDYTELNEYAATAILDELEANLGNVGYLDPVDVTAMIVETSEYLEITSDTWQTIDTYIIGYDFE